MTGGKRRVVGREWEEGKGREGDERIDRVRKGLGLWDGGGGKWEGEREARESQAERAKVYGSESLECRWSMDPVTVPVQQVEV